MTGSYKDSVPTGLEKALGRRLGLTAALLLLALLAWPAVRWAQAQGGADVSEPVQKQSIILSLAKLTVWPSKAFKQKDDPFVLGVLGGDQASSGADLLKGRTLLDGRAKLDRRIEVRYFESVEAVTACHLLFVVGTKTRVPPAALKRLAANNTLTFGEYDGFLDDGGMVLFTKDGKKVRHKISKTAAKNSELEIPPGLFY